MYRHLKEEEIRLLVANRCTAINWDDIKVVENFSPLHVHYTKFSGRIRLGYFNKEFYLPGGIIKHSGLYNTTLHNVEIGDDCCIENVKNYIANYKIGKGTYINNVDLILTDCLSSFGNGVEVAAMSETGARVVRIYDKLSSHLAYLIAINRHHDSLISKANMLIDDYVAKVSSDTGTIGEEVIITDAGCIKNVMVGDYAKLEGCAKLKNGSINSEKDDPVHIGVGVIADDFIISEGSSLEDGVTISRCFVGQACHFGHTYSATDSLFFSNCIGENGEACSIFAGPYTVTHHKSALLIAGMFSFMNAGSGSNQSNHIYKLGPVHHGILERGSKMAPDSYILWPAKVGAFSMVMGRHVHQLNTASLPFSYLIEKDNNTYIMPGANLRSIGIIRDAQKWPQRDKRKAKVKLDYINFNILSPYTISKMLDAIEILETLRSQSSAEVYDYNGAKIKSTSLENGLKYYRLAIDKFLGNSLISVLDPALKNAGDRVLDSVYIRSILEPTANFGRGKWIDLSGLIVSKDLVEVFEDKLQAGLITEIGQVAAAFAAMHLNYYSFEWVWAYDLLVKYYGLDMNSISTEDLVKIISRWKNSVVELDKLLYEDAKKEFSLNIKNGLIGDLEDDIFVKMVKRHTEKKSQLGDKIIKRLG